MRTKHRCRNGRLASAFARPCDRAGKDMVMMGRKHMIWVVSLLVILRSLALRAAAPSRSAVASVSTDTDVAEAMPGLQSTIRSTDMCTESLSPADFEALHKTLAAAIASAGSLEEIGAWLKSQQCVKSVQLADYLLKSNPPQRDFIVEFKMVGGSTVKKIVNIFDLGNQQFQFHKLRDE